MGCTEEEQIDEVEAAGSMRGALQCIEVGEAGEEAKGELGFRFCPENRREKNNNNNKKPALSSSSNPFQIERDLKCIGK